MEFVGFLGNDALKARLSAADARGKLSHCYLISGPEGSGKHTLARILSAAMQCTHASRRPCGVCPACRKVFAAQHPDVIFVRDAEHKQIAVDVRSAPRARTCLSARMRAGKKSTSLTSRWASRRRTRC